MLQNMEGFIEAQKYFRAADFANFVPRLAYRHHHQYFPFCDLNFLFYPVKYPISAELQEECCSGGLLLLGRIAAAQAGELLLLGRIPAAREGCC